MIGINRATVVGYLGNDPDTRYTASGARVVNFSMATSERWRGEDGEQKEHTEWHRVVLFGRLAEVAAEYLAKGGAVYIEGRLRTRKWQDKSGADRYTTEIVGDVLQMLDRRADSEPPPRRANGGNGARHAAGREFQAPSTAPMNDDIPF